MAGMNTNEIVWRWSLDADRCPCVIFQPQCFQGSVHFIGDCVPREGRHSRRQSRTGILPVFFTLEAGPVFLRKANVTLATGASR